jgi:phage tail-like protein
MPRVELARAFNFRVRLFLSPFVVAGKTTPGSPAGRPDSRIVDGGFQECSGLDVEMDVQEHLEGGRNDGVIKRLGRAKYQPLVLKRGMFYKLADTVRTREIVDNELWRWFQEVVSGSRPVRRYDGLVEVLDQAPRGRGGAAGIVAADPVATWFFTRGLPAKLVGPQLNAKTGEVAIEELHIAHEGLRLAYPPPPPRPT